MSRTIRNVTTERVPGKRKKGGRGGDRHIQHLPTRSARHDGFSVRLDYSDETGGIAYNKALRLVSKSIIAEQLLGD